MGVYACAKQIRLGTQDKISGEPAPHELKLVLSKPHIRPRPRDQIALLRGIELGGTCFLDVADVTTVAEDSQLTVICSKGERGDK